MAVRQTSGYRVGRIVWHAVVVSVLSSLLITGECRAVNEESYCVVLAIDNNAWVTRRDATVKSSLQVGDRLDRGDRVEVYHGSNVDLAFDKDCKNILHIKGETHLEITSLTPTDVSLDDKKGTVFALLDRLPKHNNFSIRTPSAVAAVRGTQFQVQHQYGKTDIATYRGSVQVYGLDARGNRNVNYVTLDAGNKTSISKAGEDPLEPIALSSRESSVIVEHQKRAGELREWLEDNGFIHTQSRRSQSRSIPSDSSRDTKEHNKPKKGIIVY